MQNNLVFIEDHTSHQNNSVTIQSIKTMSQSAIKE